MNLRLAIGGFCAAALIVNAAIADPPPPEQPNAGKPVASFAKPSAGGARKKIVGGVLAPEKPWQVSLFSGDSPLGADASTGHFCGGVLIRAQWVLTALTLTRDLEADTCLVVTNQSPTKLELQLVSPSEPNTAATPPSILNRWCRRRELLCRPNTRKPKPC